MSTNQPHATPFKLDLNAITEVFNPLTIPVFLFLFGTVFGFQSFFWTGEESTHYLGSIVHMGIGITFFAMYSQKPWFKRWRLKSKGRAGLILAPLVMSIISLLFLFLSNLYHDWVFNYHEISIAVILFPLAMFVRWFYNISLHQVNLGLMLGISAYACLGTSMSWVPLAVLTVALLIGRIHFGFKRHSILESGAGLLLGGGVGYLVGSMPNLFYLEFPI